MKHSFAGEGGKRRTIFAMEEKSGGGGVYVLQIKSTADNMFLKDESSVFCLMEGCEAEITRNTISEHMKYHFKVFHINIFFLFLSIVCLRFD